LSGDDDSSDTRFAEHLERFADAALRRGDDRCRDG
jgi:hypothetical protein